MIFGSKPHITRNGQRADVYHMYKDGSFLARINTSAYAFDATGHCEGLPQLDIVGYWAEAGVSENQSQGETPKLEVGKRYITRNGKQIRTITNVEAGFWVDADDDHDDHDINTFYPDGRRYRNREDPLDFVREVSATVPVENAKRFQPGVYGILSIAADGTLGNQVLSFTASRYTAEELRQAAATLISMAEGMEL